MTVWRSVLGFSVTLALLALAVLPASARIRGEEKAVLTAPPQVPPSIPRKHATQVIVELEVRQLLGEPALQAHPGGGR